MENSVKVGDHFDHDFGDEEFSFPIETVVIHIDGEIAILKVTGMTAECEDQTLRYDDVVEFFPDFTDSECNMYSRYLFLDTNTLDIFDNPYNYYACKNEDPEEDGLDEEEGPSTKNNDEQRSYPDASPEDIPF
jgi:hypothetical protein